MSEFIPLMEGLSLHLTQRENWLVFSTGCMSTMLSVDEWLRTAERSLTQPVIDVLNYHREKLGLPSILKGGLEPDQADAPAERGIGAWASAARSCLPRQDPPVRETNSP